MTKLTYSERAAREHAYDQRQGQTFLVRDRRDERYIRRFDISDLGFVEAHDYEAQTLNIDLLSGRRAKGPLMGPKVKRHAPDQYTAPSLGIDAAKLDEHLRLMTSGDATKLRAINERIGKLERERRALLEAAFDRAMVIDEPSLREALLKKRADYQRNYPLNARPKRVRGHRRGDIRP